MGNRKPSRRGEPWAVALEDPSTPQTAADPIPLQDRIPLEDRAVATSGGYGTPFDTAGQFNHIFDPANGLTSWRYKAVTVVARDATTADALSTAMSLLPLAQCQDLVQRLGLTAYFVAPDGQRLIQST